MTYDDPFEGTTIMRSSFALEREIADFVYSTRQVECVFNHGLVVSENGAMPLWRNRGCLACRAEL